MTELDNIVRSFNNYINSQKKNLLLTIINDYNLPKMEVLNKYLYNNINNYSYKSKKYNRCMARKQDGDQCTRKRKNNLEYCGKHLKNRKYGRIDDISQITDTLINNDNIIITWVEEFNGKKYLIDDNNIVYSFNIDLPKIIGIKINSDLKLLESLNIAL